MTNFPIGVKQVNSHEVTHELIGPFLAWLFIWLNDRLFGCDFAFELRHNSSLVIRFLPFQREIIWFVLSISFLFRTKLYRMRSCGKGCLSRLGRLSCRQVDDS